MYVLYLKYFSTQLKMRKLLNYSDRTDFTGYEIHCYSRMFSFLSFGCTIWHTGSYFSDQGSNWGPLKWKHRVLTPGPPGNSLKNVFFIYKNLSVIKWICPRLRLMSIQKVEERGYPHLTAAGFTEHVPPSKTGDLEDFMSNHPPTCDWSMSSTGCLSPTTHIFSD